MSGWALSPGNLHRYRQQWYHRSPCRNANFCDSRHTAPDEIDALNRKCGLKMIDELRWQYFQSPQNGGLTAGPASETRVCDEFGVG